MAKLDLVVDVDVKGDKVNRLQSTLGTVAKIGAGIAVGGVAIGTAFTKMAADAESAQTELESVFKSMRAGSFTTVKALNEQAEALANATTFDDEEVKEAQATLLTFSKVTGEAFDGAVESALDLSQFFGTDLRTASVKLGRALQDPVAGLTALGRQGIIFTDAQEETIKALVETGDIASAQGIILAEVQKQVGQVAEDAATTVPGMLEQAQNQLGEVGEAFGAAVLPLLHEFLPGVIDGLRNFAAWVTENMPAIQEVMGTVFGAIGQGAGVVGTVINFLATNIIPPLVTAFQAVAAWVAENWPVISSTVGQAIGAIINAVKVAWPIIQSIASVLFPLVSTAATVLFSALDGTFKLIGGIFEVVGNVVGTMVDVITGAWEVLASATSAVWNGIGDVIKGAINLVIDLINGFIGFLNSFQIHIPPIGIGPVSTPAFDWNGLNLPYIPRLAEGGVVTQPTLALIGEAGPEAVIPLGASGTPGMANSFNFYGNLQLPDERELVEAVERSQRLSGVGSWG